MDQRKIMSLGRSSLVISLPKEWVKLNNLTRGDIVSLDVQRNCSLVVFPTERMKTEPKEITLLIDSNEKAASITRRIIACYLNGYSSIRLSSKQTFSITQQHAIREIARKIYMRIMGSDAKNVDLTTLIDESKASIPSGIHRMYLISHSMCQDALNSLKDHDADLAKTVYSLDDDVDHFFFFLLRLLRSAILDPTLQKHLDIDPIDCLNYQMLIHRIEHVADYAADIAKNVIMLHGENLSIPEHILHMILNTYREALDAYERSVKAFFSKDITNCNNIIDQRNSVEKMNRQIASSLFKIDEEQKAPMVCAICSLRDSIGNIASFAAYIAEITLDRYYEKG